MQRKLAPDYLDRAEFGVATDYALPQRLLDLQRGIIGYLMSDAVAARVLDSGEKFDRRPTPSGCRSSTRGCRASSGATSSTARRAARDAARLRQPARRRPAAPQSRADARALLREQAQALLTRLDGATRKPQARRATPRRARTCRTAPTRCARRSPRGCRAPASEPAAGASAPARRASSHRPGPRLGRRRRSGYRRRMSSDAAPPPPPAGPPFSPPSRGRRSAPRSGSPSRSR